ncbi:MAG: N-acetyl sugar amidotransferase [Legionella sp.]|nr:N-acetyl sugar amidotransferase [Legionella sp.]
MSDTLFCKRCLYGTNHPLGLTINNEGICSGCLTHEEKDVLDWDARWQMLQNLAADYKSFDTRTYDCIVPVSGAQDSYFIVHLVKEKLGLNPLLVTYNKYWNTPLGIKNLANLRIRFNCDILVQNVNPLSVKKIVKTTLRHLGSLYWHCIAGQTVFPVQTAVRYKIPLIIWGAHQGIEQVGMFSHEHSVEMTRRYRKDHDLMGFEADDLLSDFDVLTEDDIWQYRYPDDHELNQVGVRGIYLGNYVRWDCKTQHELMIENYGYQTSSFARTFDTYDFVDCYHYMNLHDQLKMYKHGYSKVLDHACREIRYGRLTRREALQLVQHYQETPIQYSSLMCEWLGINQRALQFVLDTHRNERIWVKDEAGSWGRKEPQEKSSIVSIDRVIRFEKNASLSLNELDRHITIGKGWP